jgi:hypothetical protein
MAISCLLAGMECIEHCDLCHLLELGLLWYHPQLCLCTDGRFAEAMDAFARCSLSSFQPSKLLPLFPGLTKPWHSALNKVGLV